MRTRAEFERRIQDSRRKARRIRARHNGPISGTTSSDTFAAIADGAAPRSSHRVHVHRAPGTARNPPGVMFHRDRGTRVRAIHRRRIVPTTSTETAFSARWGEPDSFLANGGARKYFFRHARMNLIGHPQVAHDKRIEVGRISGSETCYSHTGRQSSLYYLTALEYPLRFRHLHDWPRQRHQQDRYRSTVTQLTSSNDAVTQLTILLL